MTDDGLAIIIEGRCEDWPGGARTLMPRDPHRVRHKQAYWFGAEIDPGGNEVWFRVTLEATERMREKTRGERGRRLIDELLDWMKDHQLEPDLNGFRVLVEDDGEVTIEGTPSPLPWDE